MFVTDFGDVEVLIAIAIILGGSQRSVAVWPEIGEAGVKTIVEEGRAGGIRSRSEGVLRKGNPGAANALGLDAIAIVKITVRGMGGGGGQSRQTEDGDAGCGFGTVGTICLFHK